jgi:hypothetical protein
MNTMPKLFNGFMLPNNPAATARNKLNTLTEPKAETSHRGIFALGIRLLREYEPALTFTPAACDLKT